MPRETAEWRANLIESYQASLRSVGYAIHRARERFEDSGKKDARAEADLKTLGGMASGLAEVLYLLRTGQSMQLLREMRRVGAVVVPDHILERGQPIWQPNLAAGPISDRAMELLNKMSDRERDVYLMYHVAGLPKREIARMLKVSKQAVQSYLKRAQSKVS
ncbi:MAG: sigma factor-like helix-turn-helix DNA-binding protein [Bacillota bacterium]